MTYRIQLKIVQIQQMKEKILDIKKISTLNYGQILMRHI